MKPASRLARKLRRAHGVVYVEFLLCFMPIFLLFLGGVQLSLIAGGGLLVKYAAERAARSACVVLADDPRYYEGEPMGNLSQPERSRSNERTKGRNQALLDQVGVQSGQDGDENRGSEGAALWSSSNSESLRVADIRFATALPLSGLSPRFQDVTSIVAPFLDPPSMADAIEDGPVSRLLTGLLFYNDAVTALTFPVSPGSTNLYQEQLPEGSPEVTVRVTYLQRCAIPLVSALICPKLRSLKPDDEEGQQPDRQRQASEETSVDDARVARVKDALRHVGSPDGLNLLSKTPMRVFAHEQEATVLGQWAAYRYPVAEKEAGQ